MKHLLALFVAVLLAGCAANNAAYVQRVKAYEQRMTDDWMKQNVVIGETTREQITTWYGKPTLKQSMAGSGMAALMPEEIWSYSFRFTELDTTRPNSNHFLHRTRAISFSFKDGKVTQYNAMTME